MAGGEQEVKQRDTVWDSYLLCSIAAAELKGLPIEILHVILSSCIPGPLLYLSYVDNQPSQGTWVCDNVKMQMALFLF